MGLDRFGGDRRIVLTGGRRIVCRPPTVETMRRVLTVYGAQIYALSVHARRGDAEPVSVAAVVELFASDSMAWWVIASCAEPVDGHWSDLASMSRESLATIANECLRMVDLPRCAKAIETRDAGPQSVVPDIDAHDVMICHLAQSYHCAPHDVMSWPVEAWLSALEVANFQTAEPEAVTTEYDLENIPGVGYTRVTNG